MDVTCVDAQVLPGVAELSQVEKDLWRSSGPSPVLNLGQADQGQVDQSIKGLDQLSLEDLQGQEPRTLPEHLSQCFATLMVKKVVFTSNGTFPLAAATVTRIVGLRILSPAWRRPFVQRLIPSRFAIPDLTLHWHILVT